MQPLSAIDAISPAWDHTRKLLLEPMRWKTLLKIGLVAAFAGVGSGSFNSSNFNHPGAIPHSPWHFPAIALVASVLLFAGIVVLVIWLAFFYLSSRLQFVLLDVVLRRDTTIGPAWNRFGPATWRWMGLRFLYALAALVLLLPILIPAGIAAIHNFPKDGATPPDFASLMGTFFAFIGAMVLVAMVVAIGHLLLHDFGLPSMALEGTSLQETVMRVIRLIRAEPLQILIFIVMKVIIRLVAGIAIGIAFAIGALILLIPFGGLGGILWAALHKGGGAFLVAMWFLIALLTFAYLAIMLIAAFMCVGITGTFFQAYALYFLGGHYPLLGEILQPAPVPTPPGFFYPPFPAQSPPPEPTSF
jgi:hypothetical protein